VLFDDIPGYTKSHRNLANLLTSIRGISMTIGNPTEGTEIELVRHWRRYMKEAKTIPPVEVASGALLENVKTGDDIDLFKSLIRAAGRLAGTSVLTSRAPKGRVDSAPISIIAAPAAAISSAWAAARSGSR